MTIRRWMAFGALALQVGCGGTNEAPINAVDGGPGTDASSSDGAPQADASAADARGDGGYGGCMSEAGAIDPSLKLPCMSDGDCVLAQETTDCCGTILVVGVSASQATRFAACEAAWSAHFPGCGCRSNRTTTEDGKPTLLGADAGGPQVHCVDFTSNGGICMSSTP